MSPTAAVPPVEAPPAPPERPGFLAVADVSEVSLVRTEGSPALQVEHARVGVATDDDLSRTGVLLLRQGQACPPGLATLDAVWIRYTVLGMRHEQRIPLAHGPAVRCR